MRLCNIWRARGRIFDYFLTVVRTMEARIVSALCARHSNLAQVSYRAGEREIEREIDEVVSQSKELTRRPPELVQHFRL